MAVFAHLRTLLVAVAVMATLAVLSSLLVAKPASAAVVSCTIAAPKEVRYGDTGTCVVLLQQRLGGLQADGQFGLLTHYAVVQFQRANGLQVDGMAGPKTWSKIKEGLPWYGTVVYSGTGNHAGVNVFVCRNVTNELIRFTVRNNSGYYILRVKLFFKDSSVYTYIDDINTINSVKTAWWLYDEPARVFFRAVDVNFNNGPDATVNQEFSFYRQLLPAC